MKKIHEKTQKIDLNPIYSFDAETAKVTLSTGNSKIGRMINWSTLPGNASMPLVAKGRLVTDVVGTCSDKCSGCFKNCYARRSILQHHNSVTKPWAENTLVIRFKIDECFRQIDSDIRELNKKYYQTGDPADLKYEFFRINVSGEIETVEELEHWNALAASHPELKFGVYTKNSEAIISFFTKHHQTVPNFCVNISEWHGTMEATINHLHMIGAKFNVFEYDDSNLSSCDLSEEQKQALAAKPHCPAVGPTQANRHPVNPKTGKAWHCSECRGCYTKTGIHRCVYSH